MTRPPKIIDTFALTLTKMGYEEVIYITSKSVLETHQLGSKSNISRLKKTLEEKEIIETEGELVTLADPVFTIWFKKEYM